MSIDQIVAIILRMTLLRTKPSDVITDSSDITKMETSVCFDFQPYNILKYSAQL